MYIAHEELLYFWILCVLPNFYSSATRVTVLSAKRLVQNVELAHTLRISYLCTFSEYCKLVETQTRLVYWSYFVRNRDYVLCEEHNCHLQATLG